MFVHLNNPYVNDTSLVAITPNQAFCLVYGVSRWSMLLFGIWLHSGLFYFYLTLSCWFNFLDIKNTKELYERRREEKIGGQYITFIFCLYFWVQQPFRGWGNSSWIQMKWLSPSQGVKMCKSLSLNYDSDGSIIWCFSCGSLIKKKKRLLLVEWLA